MQSTPNAMEILVLKTLLLVLLVVTLHLGTSTVSAYDYGDERFQPSTRGQRSYATPQVQQWREALNHYDWHVETALRVIACESEGNPSSVNPTTGAEGLFQLYGWRRLALRLTGLTNLQNWWINMRTAYYLWEDSGERFAFHWYSTKGCWYW